MKEIKRILKMVKPYWKGVVLALFCMIVQYSLSLLAPYYNKWIIDDIITDGKYHLVALVMSTYFLLNLVAWCFKGYGDYNLERAAQSVTNDCRESMLAHLFELPYSYFDKMRTGELMSRMTGDLDGMRVFVVQGIPNFIQNIIYFVASLIIMMSMDVMLTMVCLALSLVVVALAAIYNKKIKPIYVRMREQQARLNTVTQENIAGIKVVRSFVREDFEIEKFERENRETADLNIEATVIGAKYSPWMSFISSSYSVVIVWIGGVLIGRGDMTIGEMLTFSGYIWMLTGPIQLLSWLLSITNQAIVSSKRIFEVLDTGSDILEVEAPYLPEKSQTMGSVEFDNVSFAYTDKNVISNVSFSVPAGSTVGVMGPTGSGKSTLTVLLGRFYDVNEGSVKIDGVDVKEWGLTPLREMIGYISQDTFLFSDTIEENIKFSNPNASKEEIGEAARIADAAEFIEKMPDGYGTVIGERGMGLSGGQRQRISIARAVMRSPKILVMDDCTSAVDMETEHYIQNELKPVMEGRTTFIIAHRISSVKHADIIFFMDGGKIVERGTHDELLAMKGRYYSVFCDQYSDLQNENVNATEVQ